MKRRTFVIGLFIAWFVTAAAGGHPPPGPTPFPRAQSSYLSIADDFTDTQSCVFPVRAQTVGAGWLHTVLYADGSVKQWTLTQLGSRMTFTNTNNGKSLTSPSVNMMQERRAADGTTTFMTMRGLVRRIVVPGEGLIALELGQVIYDVRVNQGGRVSAEVVSNGLKEFTIAKLCPYLD